MMIDALHLTFYVSSRSNASYVIVKHLIAIVDMPVPTTNGNDVQAWCRYERGREVAARALTCVSVASQDPSRRPALVGQSC